jgi:hypothetical protein
MSISRIGMVLLGIAIILWALRPGVIFYPRALGIGSKEHPIPKWSGRLWFIIGGTYCILLALLTNAQSQRILSGVVSCGVGAYLITNIFLGSRQSDNQASERDVVGTPRRMEFQRGSGPDLLRYRGRSRRDATIQIAVGALFLILGLTQLFH